jgi:membrane associated rhomboid family serine protease
MAEAADTGRRDPRASGILFVLAFAAVMWVAEIVDQIAGERLDRHGIEPRDADGLTGVIAAPFLHSGFDHLVGNTLPLLVMGFAIALGGLARVLAVTAIVILVSGLGTWLVAGSGTVHIGASGVVFGYGAYLLVRGIFNRNLGHLLVGVLVALLWGGALLGGLVPQEGISWQAHLFGAIGGVVAARALAPDRDRLPRAGT